MVEEEGVEEREVGARVLPSRRSYGAYNFHWEKNRKPSERIRKLKLRKMVEDVWLWFLQNPLGFRLRSCV